MRRWALFALPFAVTAVLASSAHAGGFNLTDRGVRPLGRGFALVAGADDPQALWYNPAGLAYSGRQLLLDGSVLRMKADYTRVDGGGNVQPTVSGSPPPIPLPALAYSEDFGLEDWTFGAGVFTPHAALLDFPQTIEVDGEMRPAPQRYSLITLEGSAIAHVMVGGAWQPIPELSIGLAPTLVVGSFTARTVMSACDRFVCAQPENPEYDGLAEISTTVVEPTLGGGVIYDAGIVRIGASFRLPFTIDGGTTIDVRLPEAAIFDGAHVEGNEANLSLPFPAVVRGGVEVRPTPGLRVEAAYVWEQWSRQKRLRVEPKNVWIRDVTAIGDYEVGVVDYPRRMNDTHSVRLGGEHTRFVDGRLALRAGLQYETSSFDNAYLTPLSLDTSKVVIGAGVGFEVIDGLWIDASYGHVFLNDRNVTSSRVPQPTPLRPPPSMGEDPPTGPVMVGNGKYDMEADLIGLGLRWQVEPPERAAAASAGPASETETETETETEADAETETESAPWWDREGRAREPGGDAPQR